MPTSIADGPLGLEGVLLVEGLLTINETQNFPRYRLTKIGGLHAIGDADLPVGAPNSVQREYAYPGMNRGKTLTYEGLIEADDLQTVRQMAQNLRTMYSDRTVERVHQITPPTGYGTDTWRFNARCTALEIDDEPPQSLNRLPTKEVREFMLSLRMADSRFFYETVADSGTGAGPFTVVNGGGAPAVPGIYLTVGSLSVDDRVGIRNTTIDRRLELVAHDSVPAGRFYFDFFLRQISFQPGSTGPYTFEYAAHLDPLTSDWWDRDDPGLPPGSSSVAKIGGTNIRIVHRAASY